MSPREYIVLWRGQPATWNPDERSFYIGGRFVTPFPTGDRARRAIRHSVRYWLSTGLHPSETPSAYRVVRLREGKPRG